MKNKIGKIVMMEYKGKHEVFDYRVYTELGAKRLINNFCKKKFPNVHFYTQNIIIGRSFIKKS